MTLVDLIMKLQEITQEHPSDGTLLLDVCFEGAIIQKVEVPMDENGTPLAVNLTATIEE